MRGRLRAEGEGEGDGEAQGWDEVVRPSVLTHVGASPLAASVWLMVCPTIVQKAACCAAGARRTNLPRWA